MSPKDTQDASPLLRRASRGGQISGHLKALTPQQRGCLIVPARFSAWVEILFQYSQEQGGLTDAEIAGTFLGLPGQLECSSQLTPAQHALCRDIYVLVARRETASQPVPPLPDYPALPKAVPDPEPDRPVRALRVRFLR